MKHLQSTGGRLMVRPRRRTPALPEASKSVILWGHSSAGRAPAWHAGGQRFDPAWLHQIPPCDMIRDTGTSRPLPPSSRKLIFSQQKPVYMAARRSEEHTSELQSLMRISYAVFCLKKKNNKRS